jgi:hypothetical protein
MNVDGGWLKRIASIEIDATAPAATSVNLDPESAIGVATMRLFFGQTLPQCVVNVSTVSHVLVVGRPTTQ